VHHTKGGQRCLGISPGSAENDRHAGDHCPCGHGAEMARFRQGDGSHRTASAPRGQHSGHTFQTRSFKHACVGSEGKREIGDLRIHYRIDDHVDGRMLQPVLDEHIASLRRQLIWPWSRQCSRAPPAYSAGARLRKARKRSVGRYVSPPSIHLQAHIPFTTIATKLFASLPAPTHSAARLPNVQPPGRTLSHTSRIVPLPVHPTCHRHLERLGPNLSFFRSTKWRLGARMLRTGDLPLHGESRHLRRRHPRIQFATACPSTQTISRSRTANNAVDIAALSQLPVGRTPNRPRHLLSTGFLPLASESYLQPSCSEFDRNSEPPRYFYRWFFGYPNNRRRRCEIVPPPWFVWCQAEELATLGK